MRTTISSFVAVFLALTGCGDSGGGGDEGADTSGDGGSAGSSGSGSETGSGVEPTLPPVDGVMFVDVIDNEFLPFPVGMKWHYQSVTVEGTELIDVEVLADAKTIEGVAATVVHDISTMNGETLEDTRDWFAQDTNGNVWYLGEDTCEFENNMCTNMVGAWEWGVEGALPGIAMPGMPAVDGQPYRQEWKEGEAEDVGEVLEVDVHVEVMAGAFDGCIKTHDTSTLELTADELKYYCPGVGLVLTEEAPDVREELVSYEMP